MSNTGIMVITTEKPSVAQEYKKVLKVTSAEKRDGYIEGISPVLNKKVIITWCVGHLCTMSYPEVYDESLKKWNLDTLPFLPTEYRYEVISTVKKQFNIVKAIYNRMDISEIFYAGDAGREGLYIQMLVRKMAGHKQGIVEKVVWIDSYTEREILRGIKEAKDVIEYKNKTSAGVMRAIEDYAVGINFSRALSCKFGKTFNALIGSSSWKTIAVGRVMSCVLAMVVEREREIRAFTETPFFKIEADTGFTTEWKATQLSAFYESPHLYNENGFKERDKAEFLKATLDKDPKLEVESIEVSTEKKNAPLLFNLAELQFFCSKKYKLSPDKVLEIAQSLYEKKLITYPRTDARVLSSAVAGEININLNGLMKVGYKKDSISEIAHHGWHKFILKSKYVDDSKITDHYAIIPTGHAEALGSLSELEEKVFHDIIERFICVFYPAAEYVKAEVMLLHSMGERFYGSEKKIKVLGYLEVLDDAPTIEENKMAKVVKGQDLNTQFVVKEGKTSPPKRYTSGSMVIAMENAGKLIEDENLRAQIKGSGIGTSATRAEIIKKLIGNEYLQLNGKTQILTPGAIGEAVYDILAANMPKLLSPEMTATWEQGLAGIEEGNVSAKEYRAKMEEYIRFEVDKIKSGTDTIDFKGESETPSEPLLCPICKKGTVRENSKAFGCTEYQNGCTFTIWKTVAGKILTKNQVEKLVKGEKTSVIKGFKKKDGGTFSAALEYKDGKINFIFSKK